MSGNTGMDSSLASQIRGLLDKNPLLRARMICELLHIQYKNYGNYVNKIRSNWKHSYSERQGAKSLSFHNCRFYGFALRDLSRDNPLGWVRTRARNRMFIWRDLIGRLEWFESGRINGWVRKPASKGRVLQLLANAFFKTSLVTDINVFHQWANSFNLKGAHVVYDVGQSLPYSRIELLKDSNGVIVTTGDRSHPTGIEIQFCYPDWLERLELLQQQNIKSIEQFSGLLKELSSPKLPNGVRSGYIA